MTETAIPNSLKLRAGEWVEVRSKQEILSTLDERGQLEHMPFMPEMFQFCGRRFRVSKRAHKTCDPVNGLESRRLPSTVHLEGLRCDGSGHAQCQAGCLIFWKEAWLKRVRGAGASDGAEAPRAEVPRAEAPRARCTEANVNEGTLAPGHTPDRPDALYVCQATQVARATTCLPWWEPGQYVEDFTSGNATLFQMVSAFLFFLYHNLASSGMGFGSALRWLYDVFQKVRGGTPYPWRMGEVPKGVRTPAAHLDLQEGELARVKDYRAILATLDEEWKNRGLYFDAEMVPYTNQDFRVLKRIERIIDEKTGKMIRFKTDALILDGVVCQARYAKCRKLCPRGYYLYWREIWLDRVSPPPAGPGEANPR
jgi:hypothetical protein